VDINHRGCGAMFEGWCKARQCFADVSRHAQRHFSGNTVELDGNTEILAATLVNIDDIKLTKASEKMGDRRH